MTQLGLELMLDLHAEASSDASTDSEMLSMAQEHASASAAFRQCMLSTTADSLAAISLERCEADGPQTACC